MTEALDADEIDLSDISRPSWIFIIKNSVRRFLGDRCTDLAAGLTYYAVLSVFPAAIALMSIVGLVGQSQTTLDAILDILRDVGAGGIAETLEPTLVSLTQASGLGAGLIIGLVTALWTASGYVGAFGRAMNRIYGYEEGRPIWKLRPAMLLLTLLLVVLVAAATLALVVSGPVVEALANAIGLGSTTIGIWNIAKWPALAVVVIVAVGLLYWATPNVRQPKFHWLSPGAAVAILIWAVASLGFGFYVANFGSYNDTYGALAGVIVFLVWLWITNLALLFGAELDAELERNRELQAGVPAERRLQLPPKDDRNIVKTKAKEAAAVDEARSLRVNRGREPRSDKEGIHER